MLTWSFPDTPTPALQTFIIRYHVTDALQSSDASRQFTESMLDPLRGRLAHNHDRSPARPGRPELGATARLLGRCCGQTGITTFHQLCIP